MPRRRACTSAAVACGLALVTTAPTCSHALVAPRYGLGRVRAPIGRRRHRWAPALRRRGGGDDEEEEDDDDEEEDEDDDEEDEEDDAHLFDDDEEDGAVSDADFEGDSLKARARKAWAATPPVTQVYVGSSLALTLGSFFLAGNQWPSWLNLDWKKVMTGQLWSLGGVLYPFKMGNDDVRMPPQSESIRVECNFFYRLTSEPPLSRHGRARLVPTRFHGAPRRRPFTGFLYYGPFGLSYLLTIHFVWTYMGTLEKLQFAEPWDFLVMLLFGAASLLMGVGIGGGNARFLGHNLSCFLVYIWARTYEGQEVAVMEFFTIRAELLPSVRKSRSESGHLNAIEETQLYGDDTPEIRFPHRLPWFFAAQTYLLEHEPPVHDLLGIAIGHSYTVLRQRKRLAAPGALRAVYEARPELMAKYEAFAEEFS